MKKIAVIQFPGTNSEYETARSIREAGMEAEFFLWNRDASELANFDGYVIAGGFSYEDRGRAGLIASMDPVMQEIRVQADAGKPVLGICNGAQILVETGLVPGAKDHQKLMSLARNKRVKDGHVLGVGFYNENVNLKSSAPKGRTAFTLNYEPGEIAWAPAAHGEGRFTSSAEGLIDTLVANEQIIFKYSDAEGNVHPDFPVNPNGAVENAAAIANPQGNVMAIMPHPERAPKTPMPKIFESMRLYLEGTAIEGGKPALESNYQAPALTAYQHPKSSIEIWVSLIITDNEAQTLENALRLNGFQVSIQKWQHFEASHKDMIPGDQVDLAHALVNSGELLNTNKENFRFVLDDMSFEAEAGTHMFLVRDKEDSLGQSKTEKLAHHGVSAALKTVRHGWLWSVQADEGYNLDINALLATGVFATPLTDHEPHTKLRYSRRNSRSN